MLCWLNVLDVLFHTKLVEQRIVCDPSYGVTAITILWSDALQALVSYCGIGFGNQTSMPWFYDSGGYIGPVLLTEINQISIGIRS